MDRLCSIYRRQVIPSTSVGGDSIKFIKNNRLKDNGTTNFFIQSCVLSEEKGMDIKIKEFMLKIFKNFKKRKNLRYWPEKYNINPINGADIFYKYIFSKENQKLISGYSNKEFVEFLYKVIFNEIPKDEKIIFWLEKIDAGMTREEAVRHFALINEFEILCQYFGIKLPEKYLY